MGCSARPCWPQWVSRARESYPKHRGDLLKAAVVARDARRPSSNPAAFGNLLDVLAQQIAAHVSMRPSAPSPSWRRWFVSSACFAELSDAAANVLDFVRSLPERRVQRTRPRSVGPYGTLRHAMAPNVLRSRTVAPSPIAAVRSLPNGTRAGELDEEMVTRVGWRNCAGASTGARRHHVRPSSSRRRQARSARCRSGTAIALPTTELGRASHFNVRHALPASRPMRIDGRLLARCACRSECCCTAEQMKATGAVPDDRTIVSSVSG